MRVKLKRKIYFSYSSYTVVSKEVELPMSPVKGMYLEDGGVVSGIDMVKIYSTAAFSPSSHKVTNINGIIEVWLTSEMDRDKWNRRKRLDYLSERKEFYEKEGWKFQKSSAALAHRKLPMKK